MQGPLSVFLIDTRILVVTSSDLLLIIPLLPLPLPSASSFRFIALGKSLFISIHRQRVITGDYDAENAFVWRRKKRRKNRSLAS